MARTPFTPRRIIGTGMGFSLTRTLRLVVLALALVALAGAAPARAAALRSLTSETRAGEQLFRLTFDRPVRAGRAVDSIPDRHYYYLEFFDVDPGTNEQWNFPGAVFHVKRLHFPAQRALQVVFYTRGDANFNVSPGPAQVIEIRVRPFLPLGGRVAPGGTRKRVVIDPGHGGKPGDPEFHVGAATSRPVGGRTIYEKEITLQISQRLAALIRRAPNMEVLLTRTDDVYVSLPRRVEIAEQAGGDLFLSVHLNASDSRRKTARGFEIYYLSDGSRQVNRHLLALENEYAIDMDDESSGHEEIREILRSLAGDKLAERKAESRELCEAIAAEFKAAGPWTDSHRGVKSMPFRVLINYVMPTALVELGFLDHPSDAALLVRPEVQDEIAALLFNGINRYFAMMDPQFTPLRVDPARPPTSSPAR